MYTKMSNINSFPEIEDFNIQDTPIIKFSELPVRKVYKMCIVKTLKTKNGKDACFADFLTKDGQCYRAWLPEALITKLNDLEVDECYMLNNGLKENPKNGRTYYDTKLLA